MKLFQLVIVGVIFCMPSISMAIARHAVGLQGGYSWQSNRDPEGRQLVGSDSYIAGVSGVYQFDGSLSKLGVDYSVSVTLSRLQQYRNVRIGGSVGTFRERLMVVDWLIGARYYFMNNKWCPFVGGGMGFSYLRRNDISYRDMINQLLPNPPVGDHFNVNIFPQIGIEYRPTFRWAIGLTVRPVFAIRTKGIVPAVQVPAYVHIAF